MGNFIFVRHGQSQANAETIIADAKSPLTDSGIEQARKTGAELKVKSVTLILCSPYLRAQQTAETIASELGVDIAHIKIVDEIRERGLGVMENKPREHDGTWYFTDDNSEGIENSSELYSRMKRCLETINTLGKNEKLLVVGHAISGFYLLQAACHKPSVEAFDSPSLMSNADFIDVSY
jgi:broad specificity phosphatase PhoE